GVDQPNPFVVTNTCGASLAPGATCTITLSRIVLVTDPDPLVNFTTVVYNSNAALTGDEVTDNIFNSTPTSVNLFQPKVQVIKTGDSLSEVGATVHYHFVINNLSSSDSPALVLDSITDTLLGDLSGLAPAACDTLAFGASCSFDATYVV